MHIENDFPWRAFSFPWSSVFLNVSRDEAGCSTKFKSTLLFSPLSIIVNSNLLFLFADNLSSNESEDDFKPQEQRAVMDLAYKEIYIENCAHKNIFNSVFPCSGFIQFSTPAPGRNLDSYGRELPNIKKKKEYKRVNLKCVSCLSKLIPRILFLMGYKSLFYAHK